ncbi:MAG: His-Xaa-Ser system radical SAM maturase HxsB [Candidatus Dormibacteria bacterium]
MSKFATAETFAEPLRSGYRLLPFRFTELDPNRYVATNMAGEYVILPREELRAFVAGKLHFESALYRTLKSRHFLIDADSNVALDLLALKVRTKAHRLADFTALHIFVATLRCEHSCPYCQVSRRSDDRVAYDMSFATADKALALVFRSPSPTIKIEFQGGESMLNFELVRYVVGEARRINEHHKRKLAFVIATNLALVTDDILTFCRDNEVLVSTSLDGPADLHNANRPRPGRDSYERAVQGIERARAIVGRDNVSALMTTTLASLPRARDIVDEYLALEFQGIFLRPLSPYGFAVKTKSYAAYDADTWLDFYFEGLDYIIELNRAGHPFVEHYASLILTKMLTPFDTGYVDLRSPAGIGIGAIVYNYDGDVYASDEARMLAEMGDTTFRLGNVHLNSWEELMTSEALLDPLERSFAGSVPMCSDCAFEPYCGADPVFHHATQNDVVGHKPTSRFCTRNMAVFRHLIELMEQANTRRILLGWVR